MQFESIGRRDVNNRALSLVVVQHPDEFSAEELPIPQHFMCFLAWDSSDATIGEVARLCEALLDAGAVSISCWGDGCERVHDVFDELIAADEENGAAARYSRSIMTTWHPRESYEEALWYALVVAQPTDRFEPTCLDSVFLLVSESGRIASTRETLSQPAQMP